MNINNISWGVLIAVCSAFGVRHFLKEKRSEIPWTIWYCFWVLPFLAGGFHTYLAALSVGILLVGLFMLAKRKPYLIITVNLNSIACFAIVLGYCLCPLWAADKGMAVFGILRYLPVLLFSFFLMQFSGEQKMHFLSLLPLCGAVMTVAGCFLYVIPSVKELVTVYGRFSGFLQYPNTFAAFLLTGLAVLGVKEHLELSDWLLSIVLIGGIVFSQSRAGLLVLLFLLLTIAVFRKKLPAVIPAVLAIAACVFACCLIRNGNQMDFLGRNLDTFFERFLFYKDAVPVIFQHPFGLGYLGYRALETTFQTGRYTVSFVHNGLLQLLLDIGWIPSALAVIAVVKTMYSSRVAAVFKMVLLALTVHALVDFNMQFFLFWAIFLVCLDFETGKEYRLKQLSVALGISAVPVLLLCLWLGIGDWFYQRGNNSAAIKTVPFHTDALTSALKTTSGPEEMDRLADRILLLNPTHALVYSAKANAAYSRGQIPEMIRHKETAIQLTPYTAEEYCDYIEKLYMVMDFYVRNGDNESAAYCLKKLLAIPELIDKVAEKTDPLAHTLGAESLLILPEQYQRLLTELEKANPDF